MQDQPPITAHGSGYEFTSDENRVIGKSAFWARALGTALLITAALGLLNCNVIGACINCAVGFFVLNGGNSLDSVVKTEGNDVAHMMSALDKLGTAFSIRIAVLATATLLVLGVTAVFTVLSFMHAHATH